MKRIFGAVKKLGIPIGLSLAVSSPLIYRYISEHFFLCKQNEEVGEMVKKYRSCDLKEIEAGVIGLLKTMFKHQRKKSARTIEYNEVGDLLYDIGILKDIKAVLKDPKRQNLKVLVGSFKLIRALLKGEPRHQHLKRKRALDLGYLALIGEVLFKVPKKGTSKKKDDLLDEENGEFDEEEDSEVLVLKAKVFLWGLKIIKTLTMFDYYLRALVEEIPYGSDGCLVLAREKTFGNYLWEAIFKILSGSGNVGNYGSFGEVPSEVVVACMGIVHHCSECPLGVRRMIGFDCLPIVLKYINTSDKVLRKSVFGVVCKMLSENKKYVTDKLTEDNVRKVLVCYSPSDHPKLKESCIRIVADFVRWNLKHSEEKVKDDIALVFVEEGVSSVSLFKLTEHKRLLIRSHAEDLLKDLTDSKNCLSKKYLAKLVNLVKASKQEIEKAKIEKTRELQQKMVGMQNLQNRFGAMMGNT